MGDRDLWVVEEDDPDILYRDRPYRHLTIIRRQPHLHLLEAQGEVGRIADIDRSLHHGSRGASEQRDPSEEVDTDLMHILFLKGANTPYPVDPRYTPRSIPNPFLFLLRRIRLIWIICIQVVVELIIFGGYPLETIEVLTKSTIVLRIYSPSEFLFRQTYNCHFILLEYLNKLIVSWWE